ncbi:MAG: ABC transporter substrate-binding protein [Patescibacteria group bacterium]
MTIPRSIRIGFLIAIELGRKYTRFLFLGFLIGLTASYFFSRAYPYLASHLLYTPERIGMIGEYSPSSLPLSVQTLISHGLTDVLADGKTVGNLAESWEATNSAKTFIFTLKKDVSLANGKKLIASDINYNIKGVTFVPSNDHTLVAHLQYPYSPFPTLVSKPIILSGLRGFGDYRVQGVSLQGDTVRSIQLEPVSEKEPSKSITFYRTEAQAILAFKLGEVATLEELSSIAALKDWGKVRIDERVRYDRIVTLFFNTRDSKLADKSVRQGLSYAIPDLPQQRAGGPISKTSWAYTENVKKYTYDPVQAKKLLKDSPIASSSSELILSTFPAYLDTAQAIASAWNAQGIHTTVKVENTLIPNFQVFLSAQDLPPDPDQYPLWHSTQTVTNITGYINVKIDKLLEDGRQELDYVKRTKIYTDFQRRLVEDVPAAFLYYPTVYTVTRGK